MRKYVLTDETMKHLCYTLHRIKAVRSFGNVQEGDLGGWIESEENLSHSGDAWVSSNARVYGNAQVYGDARVDGNARVSSNNDHCGFDCFGSANRHTHAYRTENGGIELTCGCFCGSLDEFARRVEATHAGTIYEKQYKHIIGVMKIKFGIEANEEDGTEHRV